MANARAWDLLGWTVSLWGGVASRLGVAASDTLAALGVWGDERACVLAAVRAAVRANLMRC